VMQAWRLIQFPNRLRSKLLTTKYFPNGDLTDTVFPVDASPTWKGIEYGLDLVKKRDNLEDWPGSKVQIWRDPWIVRAPSRKISMKKGRSRLRWVSQLMVSGRREWDETRLKECKYPHDVQEVLKICLSQRVLDDHIAWFYERSGLFTIRSVWNVISVIRQVNP
jgi:hypothetical protein